jgi:hypothetical protein
MTPTRTDAELLLAIDVGSIQTRAMLFDVAEGHFNFVAAGMAPTTLEAPFADIGEGVRQALEELQKITGRILTGKDEHLIIPSQPDGSGIDSLVSTISVGPELNFVAVGLLPDVSLESAQRLANSAYGRLVESIGLNDRRKTETQIDAIIHAHPDVIIVAGGTDHGASRSIAKIMEVVGLACYLIPAQNKPYLLYAGNQDLAEKIKTQFESLATMRVAPNIRPSFDSEDMGPAQVSLSEIVLKVRQSRIHGLNELVDLSNGHCMPTATAFGRMIRFLSRIYDPGKGVLGVDVGASATTIAAAFAGKLNLSVHQPLGVGAGLAGLIEKVKPEDISRWLPMPVTEDVIADYLRQKLIFPASLPATPEENAIEQATVRLILRQAAKSIPLNLVAGKTYANGSGLAAPYEPILASGSVIAHAPTAGQSMMMLLDGLQPIGVTTIVLDANNLTAALGAAAGVNAVLPVQVLESGAYTNLGTVISPVSNAPYGETILNARLVFEDHNETHVEVKQGSLHVLPLARGQTAQLFLEPVGQTDLGIGRPGRGVKITGGVLGTIIDGRGRPLRMPADPIQRQEIVKKWLWALGG